MRFRRVTTRELVLVTLEKVETMAATVEEVTAALAALTTDLEALAATAKAEFAKLESEVAAGTAPNLDPLKEAIDALDVKAKAAAADVPTN